MPFIKCILVIVLLISSFSIHAQQINEIKSKLYFSENPIEFDPPIIKKQSVHYIPIRSIVNYFDGNMKKSNIKGSYIIKLKSKTLEIKPNNQKYTINKIEKKYKNKPFIYKTRLYVPMNNLLINLGYKTVQKNKNFYAYIAENKKIVKTAPKPIKKRSKTQIGQKIILDYTSSNKEEFNQMILPISNISLDIKSKKIDNIIKTDLTDFINYLGYKLYAKEKSFTLKKNQISYMFVTGINKVKIVDQSKSRIKKLNYAPSLYNNRFYVNLKQFLNDLGFDYIHQNKKIVVLKKLNSLTMNSNDSLTLNKNSRINIRNGNYLKNPFRIYWDLKFTKCPNKAVIINSDKIKQITFGQKKTTCRMVFHLKNNDQIKVAKISPLETSFSLIKSNHKKYVTKYSKGTSRRPLRGKTIIIDPGHGGYDPGAVTKRNDFEKFYTLDISKRMKKLLEQKGAKVILLRTKDTNKSLYQRVKKVNQSNGDFLVSVHINSFINGAANGSETYYYKKSERTPAIYIQKHMTRELKLKNNGIKHAKMYILKYSKIPGVLIEPCFLTNKKEYTLLKTIPFRNKIAKATVNGLEEYYKNK